MTKRLLALFIAAVMLFCLTPVPAMAETEAAETEAAESQTEPAQTEATKEQAQESTAAPAPESSTAEEKAEESGGFMTKAWAPIAVMAVIFGVVTLVKVKKKD